MMQYKIFQFKVTLTDSWPPIWRRFQVESGVSFDHFSHLIQKAIGWEGYHAYKFTIRGKDIVMPKSDGGQLYKAGDCYGNKVKLKDVLKRAGHTFKYIYDFGDWWEHDVCFEKQLNVESDRFYPVCLEGERACPPEDCGGIGGYFEKVGIMKNPQNHRDYDPETIQEIIEWMGDYDPEHFDIKETNKALRGGRSLGEFDEEPIWHFLDFSNKPFLLDDIFEDTGIKKNEDHKEQILEMIFSTGQYVIDGDKVYPSEWILKPVAIRIQPTAFEIEKGILILGHRIFPFDDGSTTLDEFEILYHFSPVETKEMTFTLEEVEIYLSLMNLNHIVVNNPEVFIKKGEKLKLEVLNLSTFYQTTHFKLKDNILLKSLNLEGLQFDLKFVSAKKLEKKKEAIKQADMTFLKHLRDVLEKKLPFTSICHQLLFTFFYMGSSAWETPGSALGPLISRVPDITFSTLADGRRLLHFEDEKPEDLGIYPDFSEFLQMDEPEYDLNTIGGILQYLHNNNNDQVVRSLLLDMFANGRKYSYEEIQDYLFADLPKPFMDTLLQKKFNDLVQHEYQKLKNSFSLEDQILPIKAIRSKTLNFMLEISKFLRFLDHLGLQPDELPKHEMMQLMELDRSLLEVLNEIDSPNALKNIQPKDLHLLNNSVQMVAKILPIIFKSIHQKLKMG